jgi:hypothetical protein
VNGDLDELATIMRVFPPLLNRMAATPASATLA